jgi:hypothetical protein
VIGAQQLVMRILTSGAEGMRNGTLPTVAKGFFFSTMSVILFMATSYLANIDRRFEGMESSIREMSQSHVSMNQAVTLQVETTSWLKTELQRHSRELERQWDRIVNIESAARKNGIEIIAPKTVPAVPSAGK